MIIYRKSGTFKVIVGSLCLFLATAGAFELWKGRLNSNSSNLTLENAVESKRTKTLSSEQRAAAMRRRSGQTSDADFLLGSLLTSPEDGALETKLIVSLSRWAEDDIHAVYRWIIENDGSLPKNRRWLGEVLVELASKQPRKALEFGLSLNKANMEMYEVIPVDLLTISVRHLSAEDAIRVMESPKRETSPSIKKPGYFVGAPYFDDFDFHALGNYIVEKKQSQTWKNYWNPVVFPSDYLSEWTEIDYDSAYTHAVAMNPYAPSAILGMEMMDVLSAYAETATHAELIERL